MYLEKINGPEDVKKLSMEQLNVLAGEMREALFHRLTKTGGHFGPNFGVVEMTIAMHCVFVHQKINLFLMCRTRPIRIRCLPAEHMVIWMKIVFTKFPGIRNHRRANMTFLLLDTLQRLSALRRTCERKRCRWWQRKYYCCNW